MRKLVLAVLMFLLVMVFSIPVFAENAPVLGWDISMPFKTGVTAFYFPTNSTYAAGVSTTIVSIKNNDPINPVLSKFSFDLDATIAQEFNETNDTLYGLGMKINYEKNMISKTGVTFTPSIGVTALKNLKGVNTGAELVRDYRFAIYGNIVLYKFR
jgi:hypothetical protein